MLAWALPQWAGYEQRKVAAGEKECSREGTLGGETPEKEPDSQDREGRFEDRAVDRRDRRRAGRPSLHRVLLRGRADAPGDGTLHEPEADRLQRHPPQAPLPADRPLGDSPRFDDPAEGEPGAPRGLHPAAPRQPSLEGDLLGPPGVGLPARSSEDPRQPSAAPEGSEGPDADQGQGVAAGRARDLSLQDQPAARQRGGLRVHRQGPLAAAPPLAPELPGEQHPQHPLQGPRLPVPDPRRRRHLRGGQGSHRRQRGLPRGALRRGPRPLQGREGPARPVPLAPGALGEHVDQGRRPGERRRARVRAEGEARPRQGRLDRRPAPRLRPHRTRPLPGRTPSSGTSRRPRRRRATTRTSS